MTTDDTERRLDEHPMHTPSDLAYFRSKGYSDNEILVFWDRDRAAGHEPLHHKPAPDIVGRLAKVARRLESTE